MMEEGRLVNCLQVPYASGALKIGKQGACKQCNCKTKADTKKWKKKIKGCVERDLSTSEKA